MKFITTSWDDGHPLDFKLANLLERYGIAATFYIPQNNAEKNVISADQIRQISKKFEVGGHTLNHVKLSSKNIDDASREIYGSYLWLEDLLGFAPVSFCFPGGKYDTELIAEVFESGYKLIRTTELLKTAFNIDMPVFPTTLQLYEHNLFTYTKHLLKRRRITSLFKLLASNSAYDIITFTENLIDHLPDNGIFHLWGHSWEIEEYNLWNKLEVILSFLANRTDFQYIENKKLLQIFRAKSNL